MTYFRGLAISTHPVASYMYVQVYRIKKTVGDKNPLRFLPGPDYKYLINFV